MRHRKTGRKLNRTASHRKAMFNNMAVSLLDHERIETTTPKAKELRSHVEKLITLGKKGGLASRRQAERIVKDRGVLNKLFGELAERFADRPGGYTRVIALRSRVGDNAPMSIIELVGAAEAVNEVAELETAASGDTEAAEA